MAETSSINQICDFYAQAILELRQEVPQLDKRAQALRSLLEALQSRANPDQAQIEKVTAALQSLELQLESARAQLNAFEEEFRLHCPPRPDI